MERRGLAAPAILVAFLSSACLGWSTLGLRAAERVEPASAVGAAEKRVAAMMRELDELSAGSDLKDGLLTRRFAEVSGEFLDPAEMARSALGVAAWHLSDRDMQRYLAAYSRHLELSFLRGVRKTGASSSRLLGSRVTPDGRLVVFTRTVTDGDEHDVGWVMCRDDPRRICDIETEGVTASSHQRSAFADRLRTGGLDDLIRALENGWLVEVP